MKDYQKEFLKLAIESGAFKLGDFTLKSGRQSPYFFNASALIEHGELNKLAELFVKKIEDAGINFDMIYGPAYKGIFLGSLLATKLSETSPMPICLSLIHISEPTRRRGISYAVFCLKKKRVKQVISPIEVHP